MELPENAEGPRSERGDTLIEVLVAIAVLAITGIALLTAFSIAITSSSEHRQLVTLDASVRAATSQAVADVQASTNNLFGASSCPIPASFTPTWTLSGSFTVTQYSVQYWNGSQFVSGCGAGYPGTNGYQPQQWTMTVASGKYQATTSTVISDPSAAPVTGGASGTQLVFLQPTSAGTGTLGSAFSPQPIVALENSSNEIVYNDASAVTMSIVSGQGGTLSSSCSAVENDGVFSFGGCAISGTTSQTGTYTFKVSDTDGLSTSTPISYSISTAPPAQLVFTNTAVSGPANSNPTLGPITVQEEDALGNAVTGTLAVNLSSSSSSGVFAAYNTTTKTCGTTTTTSLTIAANASSVEFCYGDTTAGSPTITASASGLLSATQTATISAGPKNKLVVTTAPPTTTSAGTPFNMQVSVEDQYGNVITGNTDSITLSLTTGTFASGSTNPVSANAGVATFGTLKITTAGANTITATDGSLSVTAPITITPGAATLVFNQKVTSGSYPAGTSANVGPFQLSVQDQYGNPITNGSGSAVSVLLSSTSGGSTVFTTASNGSTTTAVTFAANASTSSPFYYADTKAGTPTINASVTFNGSNISTSTSGFTISAGPKNKLVVTTAPPTTTSAGTPFNMQVSVEDQYGNVITGNTDSITLSLTTGTFASGSTNPVSANAGVATFGTLKITTAGANTITATDGSLSVTAPITITPGAATLVFNQKVTSGSYPAGTSANVGPFQLSVQDQYGNPITNGSGSAVSVLLSSTSGGSTVFTTASNGSTTTAVTFAANASTSSPFYYADTKAGTPTINASVTFNGSNISTSTSGFTISAGPKNKLVVTTAPPTTTSAGTPFNMQVSVEDQYGNVITGNTDSITLSLTTGTFASGSTNPVSANAGVATFGTLKITTAGANTITATDGSLSVTAPITITPGAATLVFNQKVTSGSYPAGTSANVGPFQLSVQDQYGNPITNGSGSAVSVLLSSTSGGSTVFTTASNGSTTTAVTFAANASTSSPFYYADTKAGTPTINASVTFNGSNISTSTSGFTISAGPKNKLVVTTQPPSSMTAGGSASFTVQVEDQYGNVVTSASDTIGVTLSSNSFASGSTTSVSANSGVANFTNLIITKPGNYTITASDTTSPSVTSVTTSPAFSVTASNASQLAFTQQPSNSTGGIAFGTQPKVTVQDQYGNTVTSDSSTVTLSITSGTPATGGPGALSGCSQTETSGVITFSGCAINTAGTGYTLHAVDGSLTTTNSSTLNITVGAAAKLAFTQQPSNSTGGIAFGTQPKVTVQDAGGNTVTSDSSTVTLSITSGTPATGGPGAPSGCSQTETSGVITFSGCAINTVGIGYTLHAVDGSLTTTNSSTLNITVGAAAKLAFTQQPSNSTGGIAFGTQPKVTVQDAGGNTVTSDSSTVTLSITSGTPATGGPARCRAARRPRRAV